MKIISFLLMGLGILMFIVGCLFKLMSWPDMFQGMYSGLAVFLIGLLLFLFKKNKAA